MATLVQCKYLSKSYRIRWLWQGKVDAIQELNWTIKLGERWAVLGPNRAGKSTLLKLIVSLIRPSQGTIERFGKPARCLTALRHIGYVSEYVLLPPYWTVKGLLFWAGTLHRLNHRELPSRVTRWLEHFGLLQYAMFRVNQLSRGLQKRLALALAWLHDPQLIVLDEPFDGLDDFGRQQLLKLLRDSSKSNVTYILATHDQDFVREWATHMLVLEQGKLKYYGPVPPDFGSKLICGCL